jgi:hypothetical protein
MQSLALREAQEVVGVFPVCLGFQVAVAVATGRHDDRNPLTGGTDEERPFSGINAGNGLLLTELPPLTAVDASNTEDAFVGIGAVGLVDTLYLNSFWHRTGSAPGELAIPGIETEPTSR